LLLIAVLSLYFIGNASLNKTYEFAPSNIAIPGDAESIAFGKHRAETLCESCHGKNLAGGKFFEDEMMGMLDAANLTTGEGGVGREYTSDEDYVRAIRHGIDPQGKPIFMPAVTSTSHLSDQDLGAIIAYLKTIPPVDNVTREKNLKLFAKILMGAGMFPKLLRQWSAMKST
jgi:mono/diheme cytochrome c family protein